MNKYISRITSSARGEIFNPLIWPFLMATASYGIAFTFFEGTESISQSSLYQAMDHLSSRFPLVWGILATLTIVFGLTFLLFNIPPAGKASGLVGFMLWLFAFFCWAFTGGWILCFAIAIPNLWFWTWQYLSLSSFRREDAQDKRTMEHYDAGEYDDGNGGKRLRETNRGRDLQSGGSYDNADDGGDLSRQIAPH